jgi:hypothetical protein
MKVVIDDVPYFPNYPEYDQYFILNSAGFYLVEKIIIKYGQMVLLLHRELMIIFQGKLVQFLVIH